tara:strand:- start:137 stop:598 length:462 start_codon:yes stop_codon:yes gene_type:complete
VKNLKELAKPFAGLVKGAAPGKFGDYVEHSAVTQRLLLHCGPYDQTVVREIYDEHKEYGKTLTGVVLELKLKIDGELITIQESGSVDKPYKVTNRKTGERMNNGERLKLAISDAHKRCAMRVGLGLHLWAQDDYFLYDQLEVKNGTTKENNNS